MAEVDGIYKRHYSINGIKLFVVHSSAFYKKKKKRKKRGCVFLLEEFRQLIHLEHILKVKIMTLFHWHFSSTNISVSLQMYLKKKQIEQTF